MDLEEQFYPPISFNLRGDENPYIILCFQIISFHAESQYPQPLSSLWDR